VNAKKSYLTNERQDGREDLKAVERDELIKNNGHKTMDYHE
jgi:hypothetical protein